MNSFEDLCRDNYGRIYRYIFAMTGNREASEDLLQDVFTVAFEKGDAFLSHENPPGFLYRTARNLTLTYIKRSRTAPQALDESVAAGGGDLFEQLVRRQDSRIDETAVAGDILGRLNTEQRALYTRRYVDRAPIRDIALEADVTESAMRMRLLRLRRDIRDIIGSLRIEDLQ
jgi:RNA polymerase sigma-70 factor (ECF subfamily)